MASQEAKKNREAAEAVKRLMDSITDAEIAAIAAKLEPLHPDEVPIGACPQGLRVVCACMRRLEPAGTMREIAGEEAVSFENPDLERQYLFLIMVASKLLNEDFGADASIRVDWQVAVPRPKMLN